jgi:FAM91 N-terminus
LKKKEYTIMLSFLLTDFLYFGHRLLYAVFVVLSENATVAELAATLQADLAQLQAAASFACRLVWAEKLMDADAILRESGTEPGLLSSILSDDEDGSNASISSDKSCQQLIVSEEPRKISGVAQFAFVVDANVTSYLMMGSLSPGMAKLLIYFCVVWIFVWLNESGKG